jgi:hypothetical protein
MYQDPQIVGPGPNDSAMLEPDPWWSNVFNTGVEYVMGEAGYDVSRRGWQGNGDATGGAAGDNSFYRDNASWQPGWGNTFGLGFLDPYGVPSGATCHDRATNHVGHHDPTLTPAENQLWTDVRTDLVTRESAAMQAAAARGETNISFWDVYDAHVNAYDTAQGNALAANPASTASNPFIDPAHMALAVYGAPLMEHVGIDAGPITGASIDLTNDPTDTAGEGWAKRMALSGGEIATGGALMAGAAGMAMTGNLPMAAATGLAGAGMAGLGMFSGAWNTATAIANGMTPGDAASGLWGVGAGVASTAGGILQDAASTVGL